MVLRKLIYVAAAVLLAIPAVGQAQNSGTTVTQLPPQTSTEVPEPGDFALFMIGITGLVVGRWTSRARRHRQEKR